MDLFLPGVPSITGADSGAVLDFEAILTCKLTSKLPVNYSWTDLTYGNSSKGPQLTVSHSGSYQCNASFNASERLQSVSAAVYNIIVNIQSKLYQLKSYVGHYKSVLMKLYARVELMSYVS